MICSGRCWLYALLVKDDKDESWFGRIRRAIMRVVDDLDNELEGRFSLPLCLSRTFERFESTAPTPKWSAPSCAAAQIR